MTFAPYQIIILIPLLTISFSLLPNVVHYLNVILVVERISSASIDHLGQLLEPLAHLGRQRRCCSEDLTILNIDRL